ncbi:unnamed protein product [Anisakis simplex]|uniref:MARVEL domain-containing protein n=1 Tax=Anisakis simplex TaxID=6269 RepID=A0A0M3JUF1_ANISI|nr:unnamed protein product [Anisakis simplex]
MGSDTFFSFPHVFKLLQSVNAIILIICIGLAEPVPSNGVVWFIIISSLTVSVTATIISVLGVQDQFLSSLCNNGITWEILELIYSFVFTILSAVSVWLCFSFIQLVVKGPSGGYVAGGVCN